MENKKRLLSKLPKVDETLRDQRLFEFFEDTPRELIADAVRERIAEERQRILKENVDHDVFDRESFISDIIEKIEEKKQFSLKKIINGTGVVLHTNLGRAVLSESACENMMRVGSGYSSLEYNLERGERGSRYSHVEDIICRLTGAEAAMVVNNNAAATFLCLISMAHGKEVVVSRGELVEIGGSFRIPDIMARSGARLVEVGTTNRTRITDYNNALTEETAAIMKIHTSNYRIVGFTEDTSIEEMAALGKERDIPVIYDAGSGLMMDLSQWGVREPIVSEYLKKGADVILFSGDKLMGGPQAGIIAGKTSIINKMKKHPMARILRVDKMTLAALEATLREYLYGNTSLLNIPTIRMITETAENMKRRGNRLIEMIRDVKSVKAEITDIIDEIGGGSAPDVQLHGIAVSLKADMAAERIERQLRKNTIPIITRIMNDMIYIHMRTVEDDEISIIADGLKKAIKRLSGEGRL